MKRWREVSWVFLVGVLAGCGDVGSIKPANESGGHTAGPERITVHRDRYGVPHVFAQSNAGVYFGYGYAVAQDRLFQMEMLKRTVQGRVAEVLGTDYLDLDIKLRTEYNHPAVRQQVDDLKTRDREILDGYAAGFNAWLKELESGGEASLPKAFGDYGFEPTPWTAYDVAMVFVGSIAHRYADFNSERDNLAFLQAMEARHGEEKAWDLFNGLKWLRDQTSPTTIERAGPEHIPEMERPAYLDRMRKTNPVARLFLDDSGQFAGLTDGPERLEAHQKRLGRVGFNAHPEFAPASNFWAVSGLEDAAGALLNGPQFGFGAPSYVYAVGLHGGDFDVVGNTLLALPSLLFAHNNYIAWGSTAGISDLTDEFFLELNPDNPEQYRYQGQWRDFDRWSETIGVRGGEPVSVIARRSVHGMVQRWDPDDHSAWARARAWEGKSVQDLMAWVWLATERTLADAEKRVADKTTNINMYTMDRHGRLGYVHGGHYPRRAPGHDSRLPVVGDGSHDWQGIRPYSENPKIIDPPQGYIVNWNNRPSANWISSDLWPATWSRVHRVQILIDAIEGLGDAGVEELVAINRQSTFEDVNHRYLMPLIEVAVAGGDSGKLASARALFQAWDRRWVADESGHFGAANALMESFVRHLLEVVFLDDIGDPEFYRLAATHYPNNPAGAALSTPLGIRALVHMLDLKQAGEEVFFDFLNGESVESVVERSLSLAIDELELNQGKDSSLWRLAAAPMVWRPFNFRGVPQASAENVFQSATYQNRGTENNVMVATGTGIVARDANPPGQAGHLNTDGSKPSHFDDQFQLYNRFEYKALPFSAEEVAAVSVSRETLVMPATLLP